jgi:EAL domain-containing protein (putative c-di-GMP-specific phosphodiesterase class I)/GGDEF domain-containing protein
MQIFTFFVIMGENMGVKKSKRILKTNMSLNYLFLCTIIAILLSFLVGLLYGLGTVNSTIFFLLVLIDIGFLLAIGYFFRYLIISDPTIELAATTLSSSNHYLADETNDFYGLPTHNAFFLKLRSILSTNIDHACLAVIHIDAIELLERMVGHQNLNSILEQVSYTLQNITCIPCVCGYKSTDEFWIFLYDKDREQILRCLDLTLNKLETLIKEVSDMQNTNCVKCGYSWYPEQATSTISLTNNAEFALYEAILLKIKNRHEFSLDAYNKQTEEYKRNVLFDQILERGEITYHFQPIIKASDSSIYGYEALMRTTGPEPMSPLEILDIAQKQNRLYEIEKSTFYNVFRIISQNSNYLQDKKIFINSIPNYPLTPDDFDTLHSAYTNYMNQLVIEITETSNQTQESMNILHQYIHLMGASLALDDYGAGYSNEANLIKNNPHYIKIDHDLISGINEDFRKQHLVSNIIKFTKQYNILSLAEGVETYDELTTVIDLGIDLIQGFYTGRPAAEFAT